MGARLPSVSRLSELEKTAVDGGPTKTACPGYPSWVSQLRRVRKKKTFCRSRLKKSKQHTSGPTTLKLPGYKSKCIALYRHVSPKGCSSQPLSQPGKHRHCGGLYTLHLHSSEPRGSSLQLSLTVTSGKKISGVDTRACAECGVQICSWRDFLLQPGQTTKGAHDCEPGTLKTTSISNDWHELGYISCSWITTCRPMSSARHIPTPASPISCPGHLVQCLLNPILPFVWASCEALSRCLGFVPARSILNPQNPEDKVSGGGFAIGFPSPAPYDLIMCA